METTETTVTAATVSARKLAANRANAAKSTGPRTPEGKARVSRNAITHGLYARDVVLTEDENETPEAFQTLCDALARDIQPANTIENLLVERLAIAHWRLRRLYRHEARSTQDDRIRDFAEHGDDDPELYPQPDLPIQLPSGHALDCILRYEAALNRTISQIMHYLIQLRTAATGLFPPPDPPFVETNPTRPPAPPPSPAVSDPSFGPPAPNPDPAQSTAPRQAKPRRGDVAG